jgi:xylose dehydrogenase (NAD/NADP)
MGESQLRWGILGCAGIALRSVIPGIQASETGVVAAIASRDLTKSKETADKLGIEKAYGSYDELLADNEIDAIYIPLPNHLHMEWTLRAAMAGKHILCEKPIALDAGQASKMVDACEQAGVQLAEAFMYRHHPRYDQIKDIIRSGEIGEVRGIHGTFTYNNAAADSNVRFHRFMGGGALYDVGCYPISAARYILEQEPSAATMHAFFSPEHDDVDMMASGLLEFNCGAALTFDCGMWAAGRNTLEVLGTLGRIELPSAFVTPPSPGSNFFVMTKEGRREVEVPEVNQYALQADDMAYAVWGKKPLRFESMDAVRNMRAIDACLQSAREHVRVVIHN